MSGFLQVMMLALMPAAGNFGGGIIAELVPNTGRALSWALHVAAGIVLAVVAVEIMPTALPNAPGWLLAVAFALGGAFYLAVNWIVERAQARKVRGAQGSAPGGSTWMIYFAVSMDLFSDGLLIGTGAASSASLALALAAGQVMADIPEGFATIINFRDKGYSRTKRILLSASFAIPVLVAAALSYLLLRDRGETLQMAALVFTAGPLVVAAVEDMISEAHESEKDTRVSIVCFVAGFGLFMLVSTLFEG